MIIDLEEEVQKPKTKGILIIALGHENYGKLAANLAMSIRYHDGEIPIHLVYTDSSIAVIKNSPKHMALFTSIAKISEDKHSYQGNKQAWIKSKSHIYELTPYDETIFIDADALIFPHIKLSDVINGLSEKTDFHMQNRGFADLSTDVKDTYCNWCNVNDLKDKYKLKDGRFYQLASEFIFFKKNKLNQDFFKKVRQIYDSRPIKPKEGFGDIPDEYAFDIASTLLKHYPFEDNKVFIYWDQIEGIKDWNRHVTSNYIGVSLGGNHITDHTMNKTKAYLSMMSRQLGLPFSYNVPPKRKWNTQRKAI